MRAATRELLASREDVWAFIAEPYHLADWWPGVVGVVPDRRGFTPEARWRVDVLVGLGGAVGPAVVGRRAQPQSHTLVIAAIDPFTRWSWELVAPAGGTRRWQGARVEIRLESAAVERTRVTVSVDARARWVSGAGEAKVARAAADRLYDLVQTAATF